MLFHEFVAEFEKRFRAGRATQIGTVKPAAFSEARLRAVRAALETTTEFLSLRFHDGLPTAALDLEPYVRRLDFWARQAHERATPVQLPQSIDTAVSNVRFSVWTVRGWHLGRSARRGPARPRESFPAWLLPLYDAGKACGVHPGFAGALGSLSDALLAHDVKALTKIPEDYETVSGWLRDAGHNDSARHFIVKIYRAAATHLDANLPQLSATANVGERGLRALPNIRQLLAKAGKPNLDPRTAGSEALVRTVAPFAHGDMYTRIQRAQGKRADWRDRQWQSLDRVLASAIRLNVDVSELDLLDLYLQVCAAPLLPTAPGSGEVLRKQRGTAVTGAVPTVPIMRAVIDESAHPSSAGSYLVTHDAVSEVWYTNTVIVDEGNIYRACAASHERLSAEDPTQWERFQFARQGIALALRQKPTLVGQVDRELLLKAVTFPQGIALGIPALTTEALELRERARARPDDARLALLYEEKNLALTAYVVMLWVGLRPKNFAGALHGKHLTPVYRGGLPVTIKSYFRGVADEDCVRLKKSKHEVSKSENFHEDEMPVGLLHPLLLADFLTQRVRRLVAGRVVPSASEYRRADDRFAFFVSPDTNDRSPGGYCPVPTGQLTGRYKGPDSLSDTFGYVLYRVATEVLGRRLPEWESPEMKTKYRGLFKAHKGVRLENGSYWGGVRQLWDYAQWRTNDTLKTLREHYSQLTPDQITGRLTGIEHPNHFDVLMDHLRAGGAVDWTAFQPERPESAIPGARRRRAA